MKILHIPDFAGVHQNRQPQTGGTFHDRPLNFIIQCMLVIEFDPFHPGGGTAFDLRHGFRCKSRIHKTEPEQPFRIAPDGFQHSIVDITHFFRRNIRQCNGAGNRQFLNTVTVRIGNDTVAIRRIQPFCTAGFFQSSPT